MLTVVVTNLSSATVDLSELYTEVGAAGASNDSVTFTCSASQLDSMNALKALVNAGTVKCAITQSSDNSDLMSLPIEQHGVTGDISTANIAIVNTALTFPKAFSAAPKVFVTLDMSAAGASVAQAYVDTVTATGCNIKVNVTANVAATHCVVNWMAVL